MAFLLLVSTTGLSIDMHFCQDQLKSISFIGKATSCHEKQSSSTCHNTKNSCQHKSDCENKNDGDDCCHNEDIVIEKTNFDATSQQIAVNHEIQFDFLAAYVSVFVFNYTFDRKTQPFKNYKTPLPDRDIRILYQTFII